jgi:hypothetical protein
LVYNAEDKVVNGKVITPKGWVAKKDLTLKYGNIDWRGPGKDDVLTWHGPEGRYFGDMTRFKDEVYHQGQLVSKAPLPCLGAAIQKDSEGRKWLLIVCKDGANEYIYTRPWGGYNHTAELYSEGANPSGWRLLGFKVLSIPEASTTAPYFFNESGTECQCARSVFISNDEGYNYYRVKIKPDIDGFSATWAVVTEEYQGIRERTETLIGGQCNNTGHGPPTLVELYGEGWRSSSTSIIGWGSTREGLGGYDAALADAAVYVASLGYGGFSRERLVSEGFNFVGLRAQTWVATFDPGSHSMLGEVSIKVAQAGIYQQPDSYVNEAKSSRSYEGKALFAVDYQADQEVLATLEPELMSPCNDHYQKNVNIIHFHPSNTPTFLPWGHPWREDYTTGSEVVTVDQSGEREVNLVIGAWKASVKSHKVSRLSNITRSYARAQGNSYVQTETHSYDQADKNARLFYLDLRMGVAVIGEAETTIGTTTEGNTKGVLIDTLFLRTPTASEALGAQLAETQSGFIGEPTCESVAALPETLLLPMETFIEQESTFSIVGGGDKFCVGSVYWVSKYNQLDSGYTLFGPFWSRWLYLIFRNTEVSSLNFLYNLETGELTDPLALIPWPEDSTYPQPLLGEAGVF